MKNFVFNLMRLKRVINPGGSKKNHRPEPVALLTIYYKGELLEEGIEPPTPFNGIKPTL